VGNNTIAFSYRYRVITAHPFVSCNNTILIMTYYLLPQEKAKNQISVFS